jgi:hypothetical protein
MKKHRPEEPVRARHEPDQHDERVDQEVDEQMSGEVAALLETSDGPLS